MAKVGRFFRDALLADPDGRLLWRSFLAFLVSLAGALACVALGLAVLELAGLPRDGMDQVDAGTGWRAFIAGVLFAPVVETLLLGGMLALMPGRWSIPSRALLAGLLWGLLHGLVAPIWFIGTWFPFFVFSCCWMTWRRRSFRHAFAAAALPHALHNLVAFWPDILAG